MPSLSFEKSKEGVPVAVVRGGDKDGEVLYLHTDTKASPKKEVKAIRYMKELSFIKPAERVQVMNKIVEGVSKDTPIETIDIPERAKEIYKRILTDNSNDKSIELPDDSTFQPIPSPDPKTRQIWYVAGQSGSGKSYFARGIAENYKKLYPDREIYLISKLQEDTTLDSMKVGKPKRINIETILTDPIDLEECKNCLIICDDWDTITPKPLYDAIHKFIEDVCIMGRHSNTSLLILSHHLSNYKSTRLMLNEAHFLVLYPMATSVKALRYVAEMYGNCSKEEISKMRNRGRWICISKTYPGYIISAQEANMLNCEAI